MFCSYVKKEQQTQQHTHVISEDEAAGLRKPLIRFHCISCDRPIDVQPHPFVSFVMIDLFRSFFRFHLIIYSTKRCFSFLSSRTLDSKRVYPQIRVCVQSSHPDHTPPTNWTKFANSKRGSLPIPSFNRKTFVFPISKF